MFGSAFLSPGRWSIALLLVCCHGLQFGLCTSFLTKGIFRSLWSVWLHGASAIALNVLDWNLWMRSIVDGFAHPQT
jgi:hypothetical protein